jgi:serine/threonine-protein kinase
MTDPDQLQTGRRLGTYELLIPLAQGATAEVWAARTIGWPSEKIVALKVLQADLGDCDAESMFLDEARLVSRIRHPNVGIVMEWIPGEPLQVVLREVARSGAGRLPLPLATRIVALAAAGLHAAHDMCDQAGRPVGLVHRDVSPQNLLVTDEGAVKVIDFGVAKAASNLQRTRVGQIKGKVAYMAPEQTAGDRLDRRTDVFALGVVLYQLVTGKHPFRGDNEFATMARIRDNKPADPPSAHAPDIPPALEAVMLRALAKPRDQRYPTMADLGRALDEALPPTPDVDRKLATFLGSVLSQRIAKRDAAIREALQAAGVEEGSSAYPVNFGPGSRRAIPSFRPPQPSAPSALPVSPGNVDAGDLPEGMRPKRGGTLKIVAAVAVAILLALAAWAAISASGPDETQPVRRSF